MMEHGRGRYDEGLGTLACAARRRARGPSGGATVRSDGAMKTALLLAFCAVTAAGCAVDGETGDEATAGDNESAVGHSDPSFIQLYNSNTKHMSEPGKPSYEGTDFTHLLAYMRAQTYLPDIITLQEIGTKTAEWTSQPCRAYVDALDRIVKTKGSTTTWSCIVAAGSTSGLDNAPGGVAIIHRARFKPAGAKNPVGLYRWNGSGCTLQSAGSGWTALVQKFIDGEHTVAVASVHLPTASDGDGATADDCSGKNLTLVRDALAATNADVKIIAGDMNHGDATRHLDPAGAVVHDNWETTYATNNDFLNASFPSKNRYRDAWFRDCAAGAAPSPTASYTKAQTVQISTCLAADNWTFNGAGKLDPRIDWVLVEGAYSLTDAKTILYADAHKAFLSLTGKPSSDATQYSDHRAQKLRVKY
jgi:hypothetical protein